MPKSETATDAPSPKPRAPDMMDVVRSLGDRKVLLMLLLGFSGGLPFMLTGNTMGMWLRDAGTDLKAIGFLSWVGLAYSFKFLWAPILDKTNVPLLGRLGHRRGWMLLAQIIIALALITMAARGPEGGLMVFGVYALIVAFASATQDIAMDAFRIESAENDEKLALLTSASMLGYRAALLLTDALIFIAVANMGWNISYAGLGLIMGVGMVATLLATEPPDRRSAATKAAKIWTVQGIWDGITGPFISFFRAHGWFALMMLAAISLYRLGDFMMGPMAGPLYIDLHIPKETIGIVRGTDGLIATIVGVALAGVSAIRFGFVRTLIIGAILGPGSNLAFSALAYAHGNLLVFNIAMVVDNFSNGFAGAALVAWMSSLTSAGYTASQYALMSSFYALLGKFLKGFSGAMVDALKTHMDLINAYAVYFAFTALIGIPALILCILVARHVEKVERADAT